MNAFDEHTLRVQMVMLLGSLPVWIAMAVTGSWALSRLHARPRASWIVLITIALTGFQLAAFMGVWSVLGYFIGLGDVLNLAATMLTNIVELVIWWLLLLGLFGPDPFRIKGETDPEWEQP